MLKSLSGVGAWKQDGVWKWYDGTPVEYFNWALGQPDNISGGEWTLAIGPYGEWKDVVSWHVGHHKGRNDDINWIAALFQIDNVKLVPINLNPTWANPMLDFTTNNNEMEWGDCLSMYIHAYFDDVTGDKFNQVWIDNTSFWANPNSDVFEQGWDYVCNDTGLNYDWGDWSYEKEFIAHATTIEGKKTKDKRQKIKVKYTQKLDKSLTVSNPVADAGQDTNINISATVDTSKLRANTPDITKIELLQQDSKNGEKVIWTDNVIATKSYNKALPVQINIPANMIDYSSGNHQYYCSIKARIYSNNKSVPQDTAQVNLTLNYKMAFSGQVTADQQIYGNMTNFSIDSGWTTNAPDAPKITKLEVIGEGVSYSETPNTSSVSKTIPIKVNIPENKIDETPSVHTYDTNVKVKFINSNGEVRESNICPVRVTYDMTPTITFTSSQNNINFKQKTKITAQAVFLDLVHIPRVPKITKIELLDNNTGEILSSVDKNTLTYDWQPEVPKHKLEKAPDVIHTYNANAVVKVTSGGGIVKSNPVNISVKYKTVYHFTQKMIGIKNQTLAPMQAFRIYVLQASEDFKQKYGHFFEKEIKVPEEIKQQLQQLREKRKA